MPDSATFHERVEACFVAYRGHGVSLSANDLELVDRWADANVPFEVIARGLRKAAEAALWDAAEGAGHLRSLRGARRQVDAEIARYLKTVVGRTAEPVAPKSPEGERLRKLTAAIRTLARGAPVLQRLVSRLEAAPVPEDFATSDRLEAWALMELARALTFSDRLTLLREARALTTRTAGMSAQVVAESLRFHRLALIKRRWEVPSLW